MAAANYAKETYGVSNQIFVRRDGRFYPYKVNDGSSRSGSRRGGWFWD